MYQVPPNPKLFKITLFSPTLLKLDVLLGWLTTYFLVQQIAKDFDPLYIKKIRKKPKPLHGYCRRNRSSYDLRDATIALKFPSLLTKLVFQWVQRSRPNIVLHVQIFLFCLFSRFSPCCGCVELCISATMLNNSWYATILPEKPISAVTHTQAQPFCQIEKNFWQIFYDLNWMVNSRLQ